MNDTSPVDSTLAPTARGELFTSWHRIIDQRNLELARATADCVRADPTRLEIARANLRQTIERGTCGGINNRYIAHWKRIFDTANMGLILTELTRDDEAGAAMRQADPFAGVLPFEARAKIVADYESKRSAFTVHAGRGPHGPPLAPAPR